MFKIVRRDHPRVTVVAAARPNFMKVGPVIRALKDRRADVQLVHTGQHYDERMYQTFFRELRLPEPDLDLGIGSGSHATQTAGVMVAFEERLRSDRPDAVIVVGDVNSTLACALAAVKLEVPVAHVEAGLRSGDWSMPEEINRLLTDRISRWLLTPSDDGDRHLADEGVPAAWVHRVGNVMIDTLLDNLPAAKLRGRAYVRDRALGQRFGLVTLHRPSNVDNATSIGALLDACAAIDPSLPLIFPAHPRTAARLRDFGVEVPSSIQIVGPLGYLDFVGLMSASLLVLTDSGGVQEETSVLGVPCLTLRDNTERPITCELGTNHLVGTNPEAIVDAGRAVLSSPPEGGSIPLWDGRAGERVAEVLLADLQTI